MISKSILILLGLLALSFGGWAANIAFADINAPISTMALMGMMGYLFHAAIIFIALTFPVEIRRKITLLLLLWHIPETLLIAVYGMGIPKDIQTSGIIIHGAFSIFAFLSWYLAADEQKEVLLSSQLEVNHE